MDARTKAAEAVLDFFASKGTIPGATEAERLECDYIRAGLVDSVGVISLVLDLESRLGVRLESSDLENPDFKTVGGLIDILSAKL